MRHWIDLIEGVNDRYLYHGTELVNAIEILRTNEITGYQQYEHNPTGVSLTRDYLTARAFGTFWDRQFPVVLVLDQGKIVARKGKTQPRRDTFGSGFQPPREAEEMVLGDLDNLDQYLVSVNVHPQHIEEALNDQSFREYIVDEKGCSPDHFPFLASREAFVAAINSLTRHPKLNRFVPRVQWGTDSEQVPTKS